MEQLGKKLYSVNGRQEVDRKRIDDFSLQRTNL